MQLLPTFLGKVGCNMSAKKFGCKTKGGCLVIIIVFILSLVLFSYMSFGSLSDYMYKAALRELGFDSKEEFEAFGEKMNQPFDDSEILVNRHTSTDVDNVNNMLFLSVELSTGESVLTNGKLNIAAIENSEEIIIKNDMNFSAKELAYFINLIIVSSQKQTVDMISDIELKQVDYYFINNQSAKFNFYLNINTNGIAKEIGKLGSFIPDRLLLNVETTLNIDEENKITAVNNDIKINNLDAETNDKFLEIFGKLINKTIVGVEQWVCDLVASVFYDFLIALNCKMIYTIDIITITSVAQGE